MLQQFEEKPNETFAVEIFLSYILFSNGYSFYLGGSLFCRLFYNHDNLFLFFFVHMIHDHENIWLIVENFNMAAALLYSYTGRRSQLPCLGSSRNHWQHPSGYVS